MANCHVCSGLLVKRADGGIVCSECSRSPRTSGREALEISDKLLVNELARRPAVLQEVLRRCRHQAADLLQDEEVVHLMYTRPLLAEILTEVHVLESDLLSDLQHQKRS